jgi:D-alanyl-D-alanine carboxypeptidase
VDLNVLEEPRSYRAIRAERERVARRRRRRHRAVLVAGTVVLALAALLVVMTATASGPSTVVASTAPQPVKPPPSRSLYGIAPSRHHVSIRLKLPLTSGLLFDVRSGRVLWQRRPTDVLPIASLTKMMTALIVVTHAREGARVLITKQATHFTGSGVGLLPLGKPVRLEALLYGLLLPSGNDAAIALAQHVAHTQGRFIAMMNREAGKLGLRCTHYTTVSGVIDQGNHSCAVDLAAIAHLVLKHRLLAKIVASRNVVLRFPIKGGKLWLYNNNPLLLTRFPGTDGVKTGYTTLAGECLVATARRGQAWLGVVLLHSGNPEAQAEALLNAGFTAERAA